MDTLSKPPDAERKSAGVVPPRANRPRRWLVKLLRSRRTWMTIVQVALATVKIAKVIHELFR